MIDTHAHIYLPEFDSDREETIQRAVVKQVEKILMPAIDSSTHEAMLATEARYPSCMAMMGLHPCSVKQDFEKELAIIQTYLLQRKFVAIGEIGLDFHWDKTFIDFQFQAFHQQVQLAVLYNLPIVIHSREATDECISVVEQYPGSRGVFHCFSGSVDQAIKIINLGFCLGIGGVITFKNAGLDKILPHIGLDHILLETDAPYLAPVPFRGKRNEPAHIMCVLEKLSSITGQSVFEIDEITTGNANRLFTLS